MIFNAELPTPQFCVLTNEIAQQKDNQIIKFCDCPVRVISGRSISNGLTLLLALEIDQIYMEYISMRIRFAKPNEKAIDFDGWEWNEKKLRRKHGKEKNK